MPGSGVARLIVGEITTGKAKGKELGKQLEQMDSECCPQCGQKMSKKKK